MSVQMKDFFSPGLKASKPHINHPPTPNLIIDNNLPSSIDAGRF